MTILSERGAPTPVAWTRLRPPSSLMAQLDPAEHTRLVQASPLLAEYGEVVDRESAYEMLLAEGRAAADAEEHDEPEAGAPQAAEGAAAGGAREQGRQACSARPCSASVARTAATVAEPRDRPVAVRHRPRRRSSSDPARRSPRAAPAGELAPRRRPAAARRRLGGGRPRARHRRLAGQQRLLGSAPGCCCWPCCAARTARRACRSASSSPTRPSSSTSSPAGWRSTSTGSTASRGSCRRATGWSTWRRWHRPQRVGAPARPRLVGGHAGARRRAGRSWGLMLSDRPDALGAFWFVLPAGVHPLRHEPAALRRGVPRRQVPGDRGDSLGTWAWQPHDPITGADQHRQPAERHRRRLRLVRPAALWLTPKVLRRLRRHRLDLGRRLRAEPGQHHDGGEHQGAADDLHRASRSPSASAATATLTTGSAVDTTAVSAGPEPRQRGEEAATATTVPDQRDPDRAEPGGRRAGQRRPASTPRGTS